MTRQGAGRYDERVIGGDVCPCDFFFLRLSI
jgi:hypothetical protein